MEKDLNTLLKNKIVIPVNEKIGNLDIKIKDNTSRLQSLKFFSIILSVLVGINTFAIVFILYNTLFAQ